LEQATSDAGIDDVTQVPPEFVEIQVALLSEAMTKTPLLEAAMCPQVELGAPVEVQFVPLFVEQ